jgi:peptidoglycan hydrolase-like protein with peptidoglycan-binding domain
MPVPRPGPAVTAAASPPVELAYVEARHAAHTVRPRGGVRWWHGVGHIGGLAGGVLVAIGGLVMQDRPASGIRDVTAGSAGRGAGAVAEVAVSLPARVDSTVEPAWTRDEITMIQSELSRLGFYRLAVDGLLGARTEAGMVEAFGDHTWRTMTANDVLTRLRPARPPAGDRGEHALRYGEMFADGLLDITLGVGFDESDWHKIVLTQVTNALVARSFVINNTLGIQLYKKAGRALPANPFGTFWVRPNALTYKPVAGAPRQIDVVVRLVSSPDGKNGAEAASAFKEGMVESDATFYGGHGRYGSGPDFDRNFTIELLDARGSLEKFFDDYGELEQYLITEGKPQGRSAWAQFQWRAGANRVVVHGDNQGNVRLTKYNPHPGEFGALLMFWNLNRPGTGVAPVTGRGGELDQQTTAHPERTYRASAFDGCRANDYEDSLRATPGMNKYFTDTFASTISLYWDNITATMAAFDDTLLDMQSAEDIAKAMDDVQTTTGRAGKGTIKAYGIDDNPIYK